MIIENIEISIQKYADLAINCVFRKEEEIGFWSKERNLLARLDLKGNYDSTFTFKRGIDTHRYVGFALAGIMDWRFSNFGSEQFDIKIKQALDYLTQEILNNKDKYPIYAVAPLIKALVQASSLFGKTHLNKAESIFDLYTGRVSFGHPEDSLFLFGVAYLYEQTKEDKYAQVIEIGYKKILDKQNKAGLFEYDNKLTTLYHQNQMYTLWGLFHAHRALNKPNENLNALEKTLQFIIEYRKLKYSEFIWCNPNIIKKTVHNLAYLLRVQKSCPSYKLLFECHQTFFFNAVDYYYQAGGTNPKYKNIALSAMAWIFGHNKLGRNLVDITGIGVPARFITNKEQLMVPGQNFKGIYEIGSYLSALSMMSKDRWNL